MKQFRFAVVASIGLAMGTSAPGQEAVSATKTGSLLIYSNVELRWNAAGDLLQDTFITLTNNGPGNVQVFMYFVNGDPPLDAAPPEAAHPGWNWVDRQVPLFGNQPAYWSAATGMPGPGGLGVVPFSILDPGVPAPGRPDPDGSGERVLRGVIYAWAVDDEQRAIAWNQLSGTTHTVRYDQHIARAGSAWAFRALAAPTGAVLLEPHGRLDLDGVEYATATNGLELDFIANGSQALSRLGAAPLGATARTDLTLHPVSADLRQESTGPVWTSAVTTIWNEDEVQFTGPDRCIGCWSQTPLAAAGPGTNHFLLSILQTDRGRATIVGSASPLCASPVSTCCSDQGTPGCDDPSVEACVCAADAFCCNTAWDSACVTRAIDECDAGCASTPSQDAALLGTAVREVAFDNGMVAASELHLAGTGSRSAVIHFDSFGGPPPESTAPAAGRATPVAQSGTSVSPGAATAGAPAGLDPVGASELGSLLVVPDVELRWDDSGVLVRDTFLTIDNTATGPGTPPARVAVFFVNGDGDLPATPGERFHPGWNRLDRTILFTPGEPRSWSAANGSGALPSFTALDPAGPGELEGRPAGDGSGDRMLRGCMLAWAVDETGQEISWNFLSGGAMTVDYRDGVSFQTRALAHRIVAGIPTGTSSGSPGELRLDGSEYTACPALLRLDTFAAGSTALSSALLPGGVTSDASLALMAMDIDLRVDHCVPVTTRADVRIWNENATQFTGVSRCVTCWDESLLSQYMPFGNHFLVANLQTDFGRAHFDGLQSAICDDPFSFPPRVTQDTALAGVVEHRQTSALGGRSSSGLNLVGSGTQSAIIHYDLLTPPCPADTNADGVVDVTDLVNVILDWGTNGSGHGGDVNADGFVDVSDLVEVVIAWGVCSPAPGSGACGPGAGDCFTMHGTPGCENPCCCTLICFDDPFCCETAWDSACANAASNTCDNSGP